MREATRKAAEREQPAGEKRNRKRMATVASIEPHPRTAETLMGVAEETEKAPKTRARVWASVRREAQGVTEEVFEEALGRDPNQQRPWVMRVDGQPQQLQDIEACTPRHAVEVILILEYLWTAAFCCYANGSEDAEACWSGRCRSCTVRPAMWPRACAAAMRI